MKPAALLLLLAVLGLTACTDQPVEPEPAPTATVTETVTADPADQLPSEDELTDAIATVMGASDPAQLPQGAAALDELSAVLTAEGDEDDQSDGAQDTNSCPAAFETQPEIAGYGLAAAQDEDTADDQEETTGLAALGFESPERATALTDEIQDFAQTCEGYEIQPLTHHTDEAFQIRVTPADEPSTSVVLVRNTTWVYAVASTPATDVGLALTLIDQLEETLR
ncbi:hypothetical protein GCM10023190_00900 [Enteractinococcus fodinae]|uniref:Sensor domain-containing protein n=1 Tax=Enteractinococcus fodinae TaxID=684663 RepID=A0ABU2B2C9_9MICC|nr:hypothetical protein [Enteractinococcus fodinae]MDR7347431.1 hypothetical protein [Enteractinococcus fodinae]